MTMADLITRLVDWLLVGSKPVSSSDDAEEQAIDDDLLDATLDDDAIDAGGL